MTPSNERLRRYLFPIIGALAGALVALIVAASGFSAAGFLPALIMFLAVLTLLVAIVALWQSLRYAFGAGDTMAARLGERSMEREALEDEKAALLRGMSDLKFEKQIGKIADGDFERLDAGLRTRAREVMRILDDDVRPFREKAESLIQEKVAAVKARDPYRGDAADDALAPKRKKKRKKVGEGPARAEAKDRAEANEASVATDRAEAKAEVVPPPAERDGPGEGPPRAEETETVAAVAPSAERDGKGEGPSRAEATDETATSALICPSCAARNDADAAFCKKCGHRLEEAGT
jgi:ribosomal protein L40E